MFTNGSNPESIGYHLKSIQLIMWVDQCEWD